jgi:hypothetical protein
MLSKVYCPNFRPFGQVYQPLWKRQIAISINHVRARWINNSFILPQKFMKFLPHIKHNRISMPQKFHFIWSPTTTVIKKTNTTSIKNLIWKIHFYSKNIKLKHDILWIQCVDNFSRIPKSPHFLFYDFSTIFYEFTKFNKYLSHIRKDRIWNLNRPKPLAPRRPWDQPGQPAHSRPS